MKKILLLAALAMTLVIPALPAHAATKQINNWVGSTATACTTQLLDFPNVPPQDKNPDDCDSDTGTASVDSNGVPMLPIDFAVGTIAGTTDTGQFVWTGGGQNALRTVFKYDEPCDGVPEGGFPIIGTATGNFLLGGTLQDASGNTGDATLLAGFDWNRSGLTALIQFHPTTTLQSDASGGSKWTAANQYGFDTAKTAADNGSSNTTGFKAEMIAPSDTVAPTVGLLQPQGGAGSNTCPAVSGNQWEVVTAYALGTFVG